MITEIAFFAYPVSDMARARAFYEGSLGLKPDSDAPGQWLEYSIAGGTFAITNAPINRQTGLKGGLIALEVDDLDQTMAQLRAAGVPIVWETCDTPVCRMAVVTDPDGNDVVIHKRKPAHA